MSDDIKVGDVCEVIDGCCAIARAKLIGVEVLVLGPQLKPSVICRVCGFREENYVEVRNLASGSAGGMPRKWLRKKRPPVDESRWIRQETVPREDFERWREQVRQAGKVEEPA